MTKCTICGKSTYHSRLDESEWCNACGAIYFNGTFLEQRKNPRTIIVRQDGRVWDFDINQTRQELTDKIMEHATPEMLLKFAKHWFDNLSMEEKINLWKEKNQEKSLKLSAFPI